MINILSIGFICLITYPLIPADTQNIPTSDVIIISITSNRFVSMKSSAGLRPKT